jgi:hypothetical protein
MGLRPPEQQDPAEFLDDEALVEEQSDLSQPHPEVAQRPDPVEAMQLPRLTPAIAGVRVHPHWTDKPISSYDRNVRTETPTSRATDPIPNTSPSDQLTQRKRQG